MTSRQKRRPANDRAFKKYVALNMRTKNKIKKLRKHLSHFPQDKCAEDALDRVEIEGFCKKNIPRIETWSPADIEGATWDKFVKGASKRIQPIHKEPEYRIFMQKTFPHIAKRKPKIRYRRRKRNA